MQRGTHLVFIFSCNKNEMTTTTNSNDSTTNSPDNEADVVKLSVVTVSTVLMAMLV